MKGLCHCLKHRCMRHKSVWALCAVPIPVVSMYLRGGGGVKDLPEEKCDWAKIYWYLM